MTKDNHHEAKVFTIIVNGRQKSFMDKNISFADVVALAFEVPPVGENVLITITYSRAGGKKPAGSLTIGESIKVKDGMIFNVTATDKS